MGKLIQWLKGAPSRAVAAFDGQPRPAQLLSTVLTTVAVVVLFDWAVDWVVFNRLFYPDQSTPQAVQAWSALIYALLLIAGLPVAFLVWHWRDRNVRDQIENARKDTNLTEFQEVQRNAAGLFDKDMPVPAKEQLQIAALHHLRGFLRGDYGPSFRRPAFELLLAGHAEAMDRIGMATLKTNMKAEDEDGERTCDFKNLRSEISTLRKKLDRVMRERMGIIRDEAESIFGSGFPLNGRTFDLLGLQDCTAMQGQILSESSLIGADLFGAQIERAILSEAQLEGANLFGAQLEGADLRWAQLEGADLSEAHLEGANLFGAQLEGANLSGANLEGANLFGAHLEGADLRGAIFDDATRVDWDWDDMTQDERQAAQDKLRDLGARHVDDPDEDEDEDEGDDVPF